MLDSILQGLLDSVKGSSAAIFLDGDGEAIAQAGSAAQDLKLQGAWKEIHLDRIKEITNRLGLGNVQAVLFSMDQGNELLAPVDKDYCLLMLMSSFADIPNAMTHLSKTIELIKKDIS